MKPVVFLDTGPLGLICHSRRSPVNLACQRWLADLKIAGRRVIVPEITDYELRRELIRIRRIAALVRLNGLALSLEYLPLTTLAMRLAAQLWAQARQTGQPTAGDNTIDADVILAAQALSLGLSDVVVATTNVGHLTRLMPAEHWQAIAP